VVGETRLFLEHQADVADKSHYLRYDDDLAEKGIRLTSKNSVPEQSETFRQQEKKTTMRVLPVTCSGWMNRSILSEFA
jgi:hypothetical protein